MITASSLPIKVDAVALAALCDRWKVAELAVFGSVLGERFGPHSDIDLLVTFRDDARHGLFAVAEMEAELEALFGRGVDLVMRRAVEESPNWIRRRAILESAMTLDTRASGEAADAAR